MKRTYLHLFTISSFVMLSGFEILKTYNVHHSTGPDFGYCGDPAQGSRTCSSCHTGPSKITLASAISSDIPKSGYVPNKTYKITVTVSEGNLIRYGFQVSPQNAKGVFAGQLVVTDEIATQLNPDDEHYINHTFDGKDFPKGTGQWSFNWIAPSAGFGDVTFYGAFLLSNSSNDSKGDIVATSTLLVSEDNLTPVNHGNLGDNNFSLNIHPNPASERIFYSIDLDNATDVSVSILQTDGKVIKTQSLKHPAPQKHELSISVSELPSGIYFLQVESNKKKLIKSFLVE